MQQTSGFPSLTDHVIGNLVKEMVIRDMIKMRVNRQVSDLLTAEKEARPSVLVCVTGQRSCERLIEQGADIAAQENMELLVLSVQPNDVKHQRDGEALEYLFTAAMNNNAQMSVYFSNDKLRSANAFIRRQNVSRFVVGVPHERGNFVRNLMESFPSVPVAIVENNESEMAAV